MRIEIYPADSDFEGDLLEVDSLWIDSSSYCEHRTSGLEGGHCWLKLRNAEGVVVGAKCRDCESSAWGSQVPSDLDIEELKAAIEEMFPREATKL